MTAVRLLTYIATGDGYVRRIPADDGGGSPPIQPGISDAGALPLGQASYDIPAGALFVSPSGSDVAAGTKAAPLRTLAKAVAKAPPGGTIVMRQGSYNEGGDTQAQAYTLGLTVQKPLTIQNYPGEQVWFDGSIQATDWTDEGSTWSTPYDRVFDHSPTFSHGQADGAGASTGAGGWFLTPDNPQACWPDMVLLDGVQLEQVQTLAEVGPGKFWVDSHDGKDSYWQVGTKLHIGDDPTGHEVRYVNKTKLCTVVNTPGPVTFRGVGIRRYATYNPGFGLCYVAAGTLSMENVHVEDTSASVIQLDTAPDCTFTKVTARRIGFNFMTGNKADRTVLDRIDLQGCNNAGWNLWGPATAAIKITKAQGVTLKDSIIKDNDTTAFWVDQTVADPHVIGCLIQNNTNRVVDFETASGAIFANNKIIHNGSYSIYIHDSDTTRCWNNTIMEDAWGVTGNGANNGTGTSTSIPILRVAQSKRRFDVAQYSYCIDTRLPSSYYTDHADHQWTVNHFEVCNSIMARCGVNTYAMLLAGNDGDSTRNPNRTWHDMTPKIDGNVYHWGANTPNYPWALAEGYQQPYSIFFDFASYQSGTGLDQHSTFTTIDPVEDDGTLINTALHGNALPLPADIAALIRQEPGSRHVGCYW